MILSAENKREPCESLQSVETCPCSSSLKGNRVAFHFSVFGGRVGALFWRVCAALLNVWLLGRAPPVGGFVPLFAGFLCILLVGCFFFVALWLSFETMKSLIENVNVMKVHF